MSCEKHCGCQWQPGESCCSYGLCVQLDTTMHVFSSEASLAERVSPHRQASSRSDARVTTAKAETVDSSDILDILLFERNLLEIINLNTQEHHHSQLWMLVALICDTVTPQEI